MKHKLKTLPAFYDAVAQGLKTFEIRRDDRGYSVGDELDLREWSPAGAGKRARYTGRRQCVRVMFVTDFEQRRGFVVMGIARVNHTQLEPLAIVTMASLVRALGGLTEPQAVKTLRCLKEAAIYDQNFNAALVLREEEMRLTGGRSGINRARSLRKRVSAN